MKIYVASGYVNKENAKMLMDELELRGHKITCDWTIKYWPSNVSDSTLNALRKEFGKEDVEGVRSCDMLVLLQPGAEGSHTELGIAIGTGKKIVIIGEKERKSVFYYIPEIDHKFEDVKSFIEFMENKAQQESPSLNRLVTMS